VTIGIICPDQGRNPPANLCRLAGTGHVVELSVAGVVTQLAILNALKAARRYFNALSYFIFMLSRN